MKDSSIKQRALGGVIWKFLEKIGKLLIQFCIEIVLASYIQSGLKTSLLYSMVVFVAMSMLLSKTKIIDSAVSIILALFGKVPGGAGYVSVAASSFMGALSGSGPGNVMATGVITIPAMKKSGFPAELAANIESTSSYLGNAIPPSSNIVAALGAFLALYPDSNMTTGQFWLVCWGCALWFILQRFIMVWAFCRYYKVKPMPKEDRISVKQALKEGWKGLFLPIIILLPFILDFAFKDSFFTARLGETGAKYMSSSILYFIAGVAGLYAILVHKNKKEVTPHKIAMVFAQGVKSLVPVVGTCLFGYMIGSLFSDLGVAENLQSIMESFNMGRLGMVLTITLITCFMGMVIPGSSLVVMFGSIFISLFAGTGINPLVAAAMLPSICGVMCGITPPLALGMYAGMTLAESDFGKTVKNDLWWVAGQYLVQVLILMGLLPILGI